MIIKYSYILRCLDIKIPLKNASTTSHPLKQEIELVPSTDKAFRRFMKSNIWLRNSGIGPINFWRQKKCITRHADLKCVLYAHEICFSNKKIVWLKVYASLQQGNVFAPVTKEQRRKRLIKFLQICLSFRYRFNPLCLINVLNMFLLSQCPRAQTKTMPLLLKTTRFQG